MYEEQDYGKCRCGAKKVKNPKTGKIFCSDKCWLNSESPSELNNRSQRSETTPKIHDTAPASKTELPDEFQS